MARAAKRWAWRRYDHMVQTGAAVRPGDGDAAVIRLRPILMTSLSTVFGILPIAIGFGAGAESRRPLGIAVVGGGIRCRKLMEIIEQHTFVEIHPEIVAVADPDESAPCMCKARQKGIDTTRDYNDFFQRDDIDLIIAGTLQMSVWFGS